MMWGTHTAGYLPKGTIPHVIADGKNKFDLSPSQVISRETMKGNSFQNLLVTCHPGTKSPMEQLEPVIIEV